MMKYKDDLNQIIILVFFVFMLFNISVFAQQNSVADKNQPSKQKIANESNNNTANNSDKNSNNDKNVNNSELINRASGHFYTGLQHYEAGRFVEALREFNLSYSIWPNADILFNIARCYERVGELQNAIQYYERYLSEKTEPPDEVQVREHINELRETAQYQEKIKSIKKNIGFLQINVDKNKADILVDDKNAGQSPLDESLQLNEGSPIIKVLEDSYQPFVAKSKVYSNRTTQAIVKLQKMTLPPGGRNYQSTRIWTWISAGISGASFLTAIILGSLGMQQIDEAEKISDIFDESGVNGYMLTSDVCYGIGLTTALTAVVLYFIEGRYIYTE